MKILMVCLGNICRSPLAEGIMRKKLQHNNAHWQVDSAGTNGEHNGEPPHRLSQKVAKLHGIDISKQRSRRFTAQDMHEYDIIYAMASDVISDMKRIAGPAYNESKVMLIMNELHPGSNKDVFDPWYGGEEGYHEVYQMLTDACEAIAQKYITAN
jgi:protein-tyrosine phosphatase